MLSVAKLTLGQAAYYERQVARGLDDYAGRGESPGIWAGAGSAGLGLLGVVGDDDLGTLQRGVNPASPRYAWPRVSFELCALLASSSRASCRRGGRDVRALLRGRCIDPLNGGAGSRAVAGKRCAL